ncbi:hypothetical protein AAC387_Pa02g0848 [Persea americana]|eukprot:TRINITY_DN4577_c0_g3_i1.p1 TRINITY_DN4577_c0_g3~~TRINITY_DN4577_c0_g3_i1.p1  ORF type:complete len:323 (-),score=83.90 TRINITY_DN4577_c0_g3_i1:349-1317(-)
MANNSNNKEPSNAPHPDRWYDLTLGSSFKDNASSKFFTLRYEFKPASIDKNQPGSLHKNKENRVTVEFQNNQPGKPKVAFEGNTEDYKDNDCVLFFDGETFRLERLHRAVKRLRYVRVHGESSAAAVAPVTTSAGPTTESRSPPLQKTTKTQQPPNKMIPHSVHLEVERIDIGERESPGPKPSGRSADYLTSQPNPASISLEQKNYELEENLDVVVFDDEGSPIKSNALAREVNTGFDINIPTQNDTDDEIADVDLSDDEAGKGPNAAEALRAQVNAEGRQTSSSSGSSSSGSSGSGSGSGSSSSDSEGSDDEASSAGDVEI